MLFLPGAQRSGASKIIRGAVRDCSADLSLSHGRLSPPAPLLPTGPELGAFEQRVRERRPLIGGKGQGLASTGQNFPANGICTHAKNAISVSADRRYSLLSASTGSTAAALRDGT